MGSASAQPEPARLRLGHEEPGRRADGLDEQPSKVVEPSEPVVGTDERVAGRRVHEAEPLEIAEVEHEAQVRAGRVAAGEQAQVLEDPGLDLARHADGWQLDALALGDAVPVAIDERRLLPLLEARASAEDPSRVVNIGSIDGIRTPVFDTHSYGPSKAAVHALTRQMAAKLVKRHVLVNAIAPGPFPTWMLSTGVGTGGDVDGTDWEAVGAMTPRGRVGSPEDIAGLTIFLCSRAGAYTVGEVITCDGGAVVS